MADINKRIIFEVELDDKGKVKIEGLTKGFVKLDTATKRVTQSIKEQAAILGETNKTLDKNIDKTGLAGATVVELGRTISDSNYGIRGMANNLSQLSTLMITLITTTGGLANGLKALWGALAGPLGVIIVFQTIITLFERWDMKAREAARATEALENKVSDLAQSFSDLTFQLTRYNTDAEKVDDVVKVLSARYSLFKKVIDSLGDDVPTERLEILIKMYQDFLFTQSSIQNKETQLKKLREDFAKVENATSTQRNRFLSDETKLKGNLFDLDLKRANFLEYFNKLIKEGKGAGESLKTLRTFKQQFLDFDKDVEKLRQESLQQFIKDQETKIAKESTDLMMMFRITTEDFKQRQKQRLDEFLESKATNAEKIKARKEYNESIILAEQELANATIAIEKRAESKRAEFRLERAQGVLNTLYKIQQAEADVADAQLMIPKVFAENAIKQRMKQLDFEIILQKGLVNIYKSGTQEKADAELKLAQLQKRLANENVSYQKQRFDEVQEIYNQAASAIGFISDAIKNREIKNAGESQEAIEAAQEKAFKINKALQISSVIMETYRNAWLAYGSQLVIGDPTSIGRAEIARVLTVVSGAAQIAAIASTKFDSGSLDKRGGSDSGGGNAFIAPDFNIVGTSETSQLAGTIAGAESKATRAYVVFDDIKDASDFDNKTQNATSFG
jgi:hypothetical protein